MMSVLMISRSVTRRDSVISAATVVTAKTELTEPVVRAEMDTPLKRAVIVRVLLNQLQVLAHRKLQVNVTNVFDKCSKTVSLGNL